MRSHFWGRKIAPFALLASFLVAGGLYDWWMLERPHQNVGSLEALRDDRGSRRSGLLPETDRPEPRGAESLHFTVRSGLLSDLRQGPAPVSPARIRIPSIGVNARVVPVGLDGGTKAVHIPSQVSVIGWYRFGPQPGRPGSALLIGHVDSKTQGPGAFFRLGDLLPGARVVIELQNRKEDTFTVVARRAYLKSGLSGRVFARSGRPILTLVTCGGRFNAATGHYVENVVVYAVPGPEEHL